MWILELLSWMAAGIGGGALFTGLARERRTRREMRIGLAGAVVGGVLGRLMDVPRHTSFSVVSVLVAIGGAVCVLLLDWLNVEEQALESGHRQG